MIRLFSAAAVLVLVLAGCSTSNNPTGPVVVNEMGKIVVSVTWPMGVTGKLAGVQRYAPDKITAYLYRLGREVTRADLVHSGSRGSADITVAAQSGYRIEMVALYNIFDQVLYTGYKDDITVLANTSTPVDISMYNAAPVLSTAKTTGDNSYILTWSRVPLATSYMVEESPSTELVSGGSLSGNKLSTTVYAGSDTTRAFTGKAPGTYYYCVFAVVPYGDSYTASVAGTSNFDFYISIQYGAMSNMISVLSGATGTMKIDIPWPLK
jgi:hypothetical protein